MIDEKAEVLSAGFYKFMALPLAERVQLIKAHFDKKKKQGKSK